MDPELTGAAHHPRVPRPLSPTFPLMGQSVILAQDDPILPGIVAIFGD